MSRAGDKLTSESWLASILDTIDEGVIVADAHGVVASFNHVAERLTGIDAARAVGRPVAEVARVVHAERGAVDVVGASLAGTSDGDDSGASEVVAVDGTRRAIAWRASPARAADGELAGAIVVLRDMTQSRRVERELRESQQFLEEAQAVAHVGSWVSAFGRDDRLVWSKETHRIFGISESEFDGRVQSFFDHVHPVDLPVVEAASAAAIRGDAKYDVTHRIVRPDGVVRWVYQQATVHPASEGVPARMVGTVQDITERKLAEEQLIHARKMETAGVLAAGVAHDFNNLMTVVLSFSSMITATTVEADPRHSYAKQISHAGERAAHLTRQLLAFGRRQVLSPRAVDLTELVKGLITMVSALTGESIEVRFWPTPTPARVFIDASQLEQVVVNLALNARDAMPEGGRLTLAVERVDLDVDRARALIGASPGPHVVLSVSDTGTGLDAAAMSHVFEPYFTTKQTGSGLGLATVHGIVRQSGGAIRVQSSPGVGARFEIFLPEHIVGTMSSADAASRDTSPRDEAKARILLVEDDAQVRDVVRFALASAGHEVEAVGTPSEAIEHVRRSEHPIDLLVTDVVLPEMSGFRLADALTREHPSLLALYVSGHAVDALGYRGLLEPGADLLEKPFTPDTLTRRVALALARRRTPPGGVGPR